MSLVPSPSYSITIRVEFLNRIGMFALIANTISAANAIAFTIKESELNEDYIVRSIFDSSVVSSVAAAVAETAERTGAA